MYNVLLVYPKFPVSFWGGEFTREMTRKKANMPPLGLLTVAALFPRDKYRLHLIDMNVEPLRPQDLNGIDMVCTSTMVVQQESLQDVITLCADRNVPIVAGGPHPTSFHDSIPGVSHFLLGEVEGYFQHFLSDWERGLAKPVYQPEYYPDNPMTWRTLEKVPLPRYDLINPKNYQTMCLQFSRGCPFDCEFCDITVLYGRVPRTKTNAQVIAEMDLLYKVGWRGNIFFVDDNFIGNKKRVREVLPEIIVWQQAHSYPFALNTEASLNLAKIEGLPELMVQAGYDMVFTGIESISLRALKQTSKVQNIDKDDPDFLLHAVKKLQSVGLEVTAGFINGLDGDNDEDTFDRQIAFIQQAGIATAMTGLLTVMRTTRLYHRMQEEQRLLGESSGNNVSISLNYIPEMPANMLIAGYKRVIGSLYDKHLKNYFDRAFTMIKRLQPHPYLKRELHWTDLRAISLSLLKQTFSAHGKNYLVFLLKVVLRRPHHLATAVSAAVKGYHFRKITRNMLQVHSFDLFLEQEKEKLLVFLDNLVNPTRHDLQQFLANLREDIEKKRRRINQRFQADIEVKLNNFYNHITDYLPWQLEKEKIYQ